jgi:hypothetical protein
MVMIAVFCWLAYRYPVETFTIGTALSGLFSIGVIVYHQYIIEQERDEY